jgi:hypothetical protein
MDFNPSAGLLFYFGLLAFWIMAAGFVVANLFHIICLRVYRLRQFFPHAYFLGFYCASALFLIARGVLAEPGPFLFFTPFLPILHFISLRIRWRFYREKFAD